MPINRLSQHRKSKWEKQIISSSNDQLGVCSTKPLVEYESFSSSEEELSKSGNLNSAQSKRKVVVTLVSSEKNSNSAKAQKSERKETSTSRSSDKTMYKSNRYSERKTSQKSPQKHFQKKDTRKVIKKDYKQLNKSPKKLILKERSRSRSLSSFTSSDFSDAGVDWHKPTQQDPYKSKRYSSNIRSPARDKFSDSDQYQSRTRGYSTYHHGQNHSPYSTHSVSTHTHSRPNVPIIRRSLTPPDQLPYNSPPRQRNTYRDKEGGRVHRNRSRSPLYNHEPSFNQRLWDFNIFC